MGDISNRNWDYWINKNVFDSGKKYMGTYECLLFPSIMAQQTVEFLESEYQIGVKSITKRPVIIQISPSQYTSELDGAFCLKMRGELDTTIPLEIVISDILLTLEAISICVDFPLTCNSVRFISGPVHHVFSANRRSIRRGVAFEVDERVLAHKKIIDDFSTLLTPIKPLEVGIRHYLTGMTLLGLEDQLSGFTDAAFMQFYQGCEALCECRSGSISEMLKTIARMNSSDSRELQIIAHQMIHVRHHFFGHGDVENNYRAIENYESAMQVTKQVLVARYLCKRLIDIRSESNTGLVRGIGFYPNGYSESFNGDIAMLNDAFRVSYDGRNVDIYDANGKICDAYRID